MTLDTRFRSLAAKMTATYGKAITLREVTSTFDPGTGTTTEVTADYSVHTAPPEPYALRYIDGTLVRAGDMRLLVAATDPGLEVEPEMDWRVVMDGDVWEIVNLRPIWSGEQVAAYEIQVRR